MVKLWLSCNFLKNDCRGSLVTRLPGSCLLNYGLVESTSVNPGFMLDTLTAEPGRDLSTARHPLSGQISWQSGDERAEVGFLSRAFSFTFFLKCQRASGQGDSIEASEWHSCFRLLPWTEVRRADSCTDIWSEGFWGAHLRLFHTNHPLLLLTLILPP